MTAVANSVIYLQVQGYFPQFPKSTNCLHFLKSKMYTITKTNKSKTSQTKTKSKTKSKTSKSKTKSKIQNKN